MTTTTTEELPLEPVSEQRDTFTAKDATPRPIHVIARDIARTWPKVNYAATPYLFAMRDIESINDQYMCDSAKSIVAYFLGNAKTWRGDDARRIKAELKALLH